MLTEVCPKCRGTAHYELSEDTVVLRCICGLHKYMQVTENDMVIETRLNKRETVLPRKDSKIAIVLGYVASKYPASVTTRSVSTGTHEDPNAVCSRLAVLYNRQLIDKVESRRCFADGSIWVLSEVGRVLLGVGQVRQI